MPTLRKTCIVIIIINGALAIISTLIATYTISYFNTPITTPLITSSTVSPTYYLKESLILHQQKYPFDISKTKKLCNVSYYKSFGRIYNCSSNSSSKLRIGIVSVQLLFNNEWDETNDINMKSSINFRMALTNHIGYTIKHCYVYFEIRNLVEPKLNDGYLKHSHVIKGQKPFIITHILNDFNDSIDYLLWVDTDVLFYECTYSIESHLIQRAHKMYNKLYINHEYDFIWDRNMNSGIMLFKNSIWCKSFLFKTQYILMNARKFGFYSAPPLYSGDQKCFWALISGYDPDDEKQSFSIHLQWFVDYYEHRFNISQITFNQMVMDETNQSILQWFSQHIIKKEFVNHIALLPSFYMNFGVSWFYNKQYTAAIGSDPFIVHFAGPPKHKAFINKEPFIYLNCFAPI